jgi:uncharacterized protein YlxW (UPF0749 family)
MSDQTEFFRNRLSLLIVAIAVSASFAAFAAVLGVGLSRTESRTAVKAAEDQLKQDSERIRDMQAILVEYKSMQQTDFDNLRTRFDALSAQIDIIRRDNTVAQKAIESIDARLNEIVQKVNALPSREGKTQPK